jgi:hypothetical protein
VPRQPYGQEAHTQDAAEPSISSAQQGGPIRAQSTCLPVLELHRREHQPHTTPVPVAFPRPCTALSREQAVTGTSLNGQGKQAKTNGMAPKQPTAHYRREAPLYTAEVPVLPSPGGLIYAALRITQRLGLTAASLRRQLRITPLDALADSVQPTCVSPPGRGDPTPPIAHKGAGDRSDVRRPFAAAGPPLLAECIQDEPEQTELTPGGLQSPERPPQPPDGDGDVLQPAPERPRAPRPGAWSMSRRCDPTAPADQRKIPYWATKMPPSSLLGQG